MKTGLVLEGGGMRGLYTQGVLDYMMEKDMHYDVCIGVSAGACGGVSYVAGQKGRSKRINIGYCGDKRYVSLSNYFKEKSIFGMDFLFDEIPSRLDPFDYDALEASDCEFLAGVTDMETGKPVYFGKEHMRGTSVIIRASSAIPLFSPPVEYQGRKYLDGGTSDPIPVEEALRRGCDRVTVVLTRHRGFVKEPEKFRAFYRRAFRDYPGMIDVLDNRHKIYNDTLARIAELEKEGKAIVIAPREPVTISRFEKNKEKLTALYDSGYDDAARLYEQLLPYARPNA